MQFNTIVESLIKEQKVDEDEFSNLPWSIEIKKDPNGSKEYNALGDLIIKLVEIRSKM
jgi:hypothetical protein